MTGLDTRPGSSSLRKIGVAGVCRRLVVAVACGFGLAAAAEPRPPGDDETVRAWAAAELPALVEIYRGLHAHQELSLQERETAARIAGLWREAGFEVTAGVGGHGVVALLRNGAGPTVMLRADLDGLPVTEETGLPYASQVRVKDGRGAETGVMHACAHDIHMTTLVGVARFLAGHRQMWRGTVLLVGQPAEETLQGAKAMLDDGLFERFPKPDVAIAQHVDAAMAAGHVGVRAGHVLANSDTIDIVVRGRGGRVEPARQAMGAEDFSRYGKAGVPILMFQLGTIAAPRLDRYRELGQTPPSLHSALFYPDAEPTLETGVVAMTSAAPELLR